MKGVPDMQTDHDTQNNQTGKQREVKTYSDGQTVVTEYSDTGNTVLVTRPDGSREWSEYLNTENRAYRIIGRREVTRADGSSWECTALREDGTRHLTYISVDGIRVECDVHDGDVNFIFEPVKILPETVTVTPSCPLLMIEISDDCKYFRALCFAKPGETAYRDMIYTGSLEFSGSLCIQAVTDDSVTYTVPGHFFLNCDPVTETIRRGESIKHDFTRSVHSSHPEWEDEIEEIYCSIRVQYLLQN